MNSTRPAYFLFGKEIGKEELTFFLEKKKVSKEKPKFSALDTPLAWLPDNTGVIYIIKDRQWGWMGEGYEEEAFFRLEGAEEKFFIDLRSLWYRRGSQERRSKMDSFKTP